MTQTERVVEYIRTHPGCTTMEITLALSPFVSNPRARMSDARKHGYEFIQWRDDHKVFRYSVRGVERSRPEPIRGSQESLAL